MDTVNKNNSPIKKINDPNIAIKKINKIIELINLKFYNSDDCLKYIISELNNDF